MLRLGVLYCTAGQTEEEDMFGNGNDEISPLMF
jgi:hypothetical protein